MTVILRTLTISSSHLVPLLASRYSSRCSSHHPNLASLSPFHNIPCTLQRSRNTKASGYHTILTSHPTGLRRFPPSKLPSNLRTGMAFYPGLSSSSTPVTPRVRSLTSQLRFGSSSYVRSTASCCWRTRCTRITCTNVSIIPSRHSKRLSQTHNRRFPSCRTIRYRRG